MILAYNPGSPDFLVLSTTEQEDLVFRLQIQRQQRQLDAKQSRPKKKRLADSIESLSKKDQKAYSEIKNLMARRQLKNLTRRNNQK